MANLDKNFFRLLRKNGYKPVRQNGSHIIWENENGDKITANRKINCMVAKRLIKEHAIKVN